MMSEKLGPETWREEDRAILIDELGEDHADVLLERATPHRLAKGEPLFRYQAPADALYLLLDGRIALSVELGEHSIQIGELERGNWVGLVALFSGSGQSATTVTADEDCRLLRLSFTDFQTMIAKAPETACYLTHVMVPMLIHRLRVLANDPILDPAGQLLVPGKMSLPHDDRPHHEHGLAHFFKHLWGSD